MFQKILMQKMAPQKLSTGLQMLQRQTLEELEMKVEEVEALVMVLMDTEEMQELETMEMSQVTTPELEWGVGINECMEEWVGLGELIYLRV